MSCSECSSAWHGKLIWPHARSLRADEIEPMRAYLKFVQRDPLPTTDEGTRARLAEGAQRWPAIAALFGAAHSAVADSR